MEPAEPHIELPTPTEAHGSMAAFWAMRKRQKEEAAAKASATTKASAAVTENVVAENVFPDIEEEEEAGYLLSFISFYFASFFRNIYAIKIKKISIRRRPSVHSLL